MGNDKVTLHRAYGMGNIAAPDFGHIIYYIQHVICEGFDKQVKYNIKG